MIFEKIENVENVENMENSEILKTFVQINFKNAKCLLNDFENYEQINKYIDEYYISYNKENEKSLNFIGFKKYDNKIYSKFEQIPLKSIYYDYFYNIQNLLTELIPILKNEISFKKHLNLLNEIEQFLISDNNYSYEYNFIENIINNYYFVYYDENIKNNMFFEKYLSKFNLENENKKNENIKFHYKILRKIFSEITKILVKILKENEIKTNLKSLI